MNKIGFVVVAVNRSIFIYVITVLEFQIVWYLTVKIKTKMFKKVAK